MAQIFITRKIPQAGIDLLKDAGHEVTINSLDRILTKEELISALKQKPYEALVTLLTDNINAEIIDLLPNLKIVSNYAVGYNNIDLAACHNRGILVTNTPGVLTNSVAEFTIALLLALAKRIPEADQFTRKLQYQGWSPELLLGSDLAGKNLGIVGAGRIGTEVAKKAHYGLGMNIIYTDTKPNENFEQAVPCKFMSSLDELLPQVDALSLHVPLIEATHHLINEERIKKMKSTALLINTARGPIIDEVALVAALNNNSITGAALDVFEHEPALSPGMTDLYNLIITPHIASASLETRQEMSKIAASSIIDHFLGKKPQFLVLD